MKSIEINKNEHTNLNQGIKDLLTWCSVVGVKVEFKLADRMKERNLSVRQVSSLTGLRIATISDLMTGKKGSVNLAHLFILMLVLRISNIEDIISINIPKELGETIPEDSLNWIKTNEIPESTKLFSSIIQEEISIDSLMEK